MTGQEKIARGYRVSIRQPEQEVDVYHVSYSARGLPNVRGNGEAPGSVPPPFEAVAAVRGDEIDVRWNNPPQDSEATQDGFDQDVRGRVRILHGWLARLSSLVGSVEGWGRELGWATRRVEKRMEDAQIGKYQAPGLLMQEGTDRLLLEPIGRSAPGAEGVVDLYLMPAYDDIASLYHSDGRWNLHYSPPNSPRVANLRDAPARPLSKETLQEVLTEMREHAA
jgi:hypothetical protein